MVNGPNGNDEMIQLQGGVGARGLSVSARGMRARARVCVQLDSLSWVLMAISS